MVTEDLKDATVPAITYVEKMRDYSNEPFFVKKKEDMIQLLEKYGLPNGEKFVRSDVKEEE